MYFYYFASTLGIKIWWKKYLTSLQITQFVIDLLAIYFASFSFYASKFNRDYGLNIAVAGDCAGSPYSAGVGMVILTSYLFLFISFYQKTYATKDKNTSLAGKKKSQWCS